MSPVQAPEHSARRYIAIACPPSLPRDARWREVKTPEQPIGFVLQRSRRKSIGLTINDDGLRVVAPTWVTLTQIDAAVVEKASWILSKLRKRQVRQEQLAQAQVLWQTNGVVPYLGARVVLALDETLPSARFEGQDFAPANGDVLRLPLPNNADHDRVRDCVHAWLQQQAAIWFARRLEHFLRLSQSTMRRWRLASATTRWGSCSSEGNIMLNWRLIHFGHDIVDYVIAHEVSHLREMNHSQNFWRQVERILPEFAQARAALRPHHPGSLPLL